SPTTLHAVARILLLPRPCTNPRRWDAKPESVRSGHESYRGSSTGRLSLASSDCPAPSQSAWQTDSESPALSFAGLRSYIGSRSLGPPDSKSASPGLGNAPAPP